MISRVGPPIQTQGVVRFTALIFLSALAIRIGLLFLFPGFDVIKPMEMERVARSFAETGVLANPYAAPTGPTAHVLPLYPMLLGSIYKIWGTGQTGRMVQGLFSCTLASLRCAFLFPFALFVGLNRRTAQLASIASVFYIAGFATEIRGGWEAPLTALFLMGLLWLVIVVMRRGELSFPVAAGCGLYLGIAAMVSATLLLASAGFAAAGVWVFRRRILRYMAWGGVCVAVTILCMTPWALRNRKQLGHTIWSRSDFGLEIWLAYHEGAGIGVFDTDLSTGPANNVEACKPVRALGEVKYNQLLERETRQWIHRNPQKAAQLFVGHTIYFWFPPGQWIPVRVIRALLTVFAVWGLGLLLAKREHIGYLFAVLWILYPLIYYLVNWSSRYRYPMEWTLVLAASVVPSVLWSKYRGSLIPTKIERGVVWSALKKATIEI